MAGLLQDPRGSLVLAERGDAEPVPRHPAFRLFAAMNPATDAGGQWTCCRVEVPHCLLSQGSRALRTLSHMLLYHGPSSHTP